MPARLRRVSLDGRRYLFFFFAYTSSLQPIVLGLPWLQRHNPIIEWISGEATFSSDFCKTHCLPPVLAASVQADPDPPDISSVPQHYHDLKEVFSKARAMSLPPHCPYDCCIDRLPGTSPPRGKLHSLSAPETQSMREYIRSSLEAGIICPSSSPTGAGGFFVAKKDKSLRPCTDYRGLNSITVKNRYPSLN